MSNADLFFDGLKLMILGMGVVFAFLVLMIILMNIMNKALAPFVKKIEAKEAAARAAMAPKSSSSKDADLVAAAVAAVKTFLGK